MGFALRTINSGVGIFVRRLRRVSIGGGTHVNWWRVGLKGGGKATIGIGSIVKCRIDFDSPYGVVTVGDRAFIGASTLICHTRISIGNDVIISWGVTIVDHDSHSSVWEKRSRDVEDWWRGQKQWDGITIEPVAICDKAWIGFGAAILKGVTVGEGAVIGAHSVVTRSVEPYTVVAGNPAKIVRRLDAASVRR